ncbi:hypothetical protein BGY98DRAFT_984123 [Russula aff. rugulosa BPL654]|nr:hypothetical protein BGY98DRAFT_984123 [Russula aff. rugulosa BPL654]
MLWLRARADVLCRPLRARHSIAATATAAVGPLFRGIIWEIIVRGVRSLTGLTAQPQLFPIRHCRVIVRVPSPSPHRLLLDPLSTNALLNKTRCITRPRDTVRQLNLVVRVQPFLPPGHRIVKDFYRVRAHFNYLSYSYRSREREVGDRKGEKNTEGRRIPSHFVGYVMLIR